MAKNITVLLLYNAPNEVRGKMRRYFYEVKPNTFIGTISAKVRNTLWQYLSNINIEATIIFTTNNEQGFSFLTTKTSTSYIMEDFDGIQVPTMTNYTFGLNDIYAKPDVKLTDHCLDVGYIAMVLMEEGRAKETVNAISEYTGFDKETVINSIAWLCAVHDIGKAHPKFFEKLAQNSEDLFEQLNFLKEKGIIPKNQIGTADFRHERYSRDIVQNYFRSQNIKNAKSFSRLLAFHHQGKTTAGFSDLIELTDENWVRAQNELFAIINQHWNLDPTFIGSYKTDCDGVKYSILSILVTADWIASGTTWHELQKTIPDRKLCAQKFIQDHYLRSIPLTELLKNIAWNDVFSFEPNILQQKTIEAAKAEPDLMIIEYPCGGGKTEAALAAAAIMGKNKSGFFIGMPTMATAKGMTSRITQIKEQLGFDFVVPEFDSSVLWSDDDMTKIPNEIWTSKSRHRMLYPFAVGTIDQILKTMLYSRYACIGLMGLADKVLIIDEVHAYDTYMLEEIKLLLKWAKFLKIPVILLSATLPTLTKVELLKAAGCETTKEEHLLQAYPLITTVKNTNFSCIEVPCEGRTIPLKVIETEDIPKTWDALLKDVKPGCTAMIEGTVDDTWSLFDLAQSNGLTPVMFNGRDTLQHKINKTDLLLNTVGKTGKKLENRPDFFLLTATSIIEQSLDIDLDRMITMIAPIDLLIQRFGRVWRHNDQGTIRETEKIIDPITVILPVNLQDTKYTYIYAKPILENTIALLKSISEINTVRDARYIIDTVYNDLQLFIKAKAQIKARSNLISDPENNNMFSRESYIQFNPVQNETRYVTYPSSSIAIVEPEELKNIETDYKVIQHIMLNNVISNIPDYKIQQIIAVQTKYRQKLLDGVVFYNKEDLAEEGIQLTDDGLRWNRK